jgi:hypothetical protein
MRIQVSRIALAIVAAAAPVLTFGQISGSEITTSNLQSGVTVAHQPVKLGPYTAEFKTTSVQTLANGTTITRTSTETRALDSEGRRMTSRSNLIGGNQSVASFVHIEDPVENTQINWSGTIKQARVTKLPPQDQRHGCWASDSGSLQMNYGPITPRPTTARASSGEAAALMAAKPSVAREDLGVRTIPAGQIGNDQPMVTTTESWHSASLGFEVRQVSESPQSGKSTMELVSIDQSEPPITTFQPPEGYEVTTEELHQVQCPETVKP